MDNFLTQIKKKSLETFLYFKTFCEAHGLLFYFCGGCCIGAIRHKGFIPWDDDIDVFMPRKDYEKLTKLWPKYAATEYFSLVRANSPDFNSQIFTTIVNNKTTLIKPHQKELDIPHGVTIDVFPLDGCPSSRFARKMQLFWSLIYDLYLAQIVPKNHGKFVTFIGQALLKIVPSKNVRYKIWKYAEKKMSKYKIEDCKYITELCAGPKYMRIEYPKEIFANSVEKEFEGYMMPVPVGYDTYLKMAFGDYMTVPPENNRNTCHDVYFYDFDSPYTKYKGIKYCVEKKQIK